MKKETLSQTRIISLDVIRGTAILGILLMNIQSFSMPGQAYLNPMAYGNMTGLDRWVWVLSHLLADQKFLSIFSMLFGASLVMIAEKAEARTGRSWPTHYQRNFWLLMFGLIHGYFFWYGDILAPYAFCSFFIFFFRKLSVKKLLFLGLLFFSVSSVIHIVKGMELMALPDSILEQIQTGWAPGDKISQRIVTGYQGNWPSQMAQRVRMLEMMYTELFPTFYLWRISGLMLMGMALFKSGFLQGKGSKRLYRTIFYTGLGLGLPLVIAGLLFNFGHNWQMQYSLYFGAEFNYWGSLFMSLAYISALVLWGQSGKGKRLVVWLGNTGKMALSNYLLQTLICTLIFYGHGLGMFGKVSRVGQLAIVISVWTFQILLSQYWQKHFRFGPMEWCWRSLTHLKIQPARKSQ